jgi:hypothetical protein
MGQPRQAELSNLVNTLATQLSNSGTLPQRLVPVSSLAFTDVTNASPGQSITSNTITV